MSNVQTCIQLLQHVLPECLVKDKCSQVDCAWLSAQVNEAAEIIYDLVDPNANLIFGAVMDQALGQEVRPTSPHLHVLCCSCPFSGSCI